MYLFLCKHSDLQCYIQISSCLHLHRGVQPQEYSPCTADNLSMCAKTPHATQPGYRGQQHDMKKANDQIKKIGSCQLTSHKYYVGSLYANLLYDDLPSKSENTQS